LLFFLFGFVVRVEPTVNGYKNDQLKKSEVVLL